MENCHRFVKVNSDYMANKLDNYFFEKVWDNCLIYMKFENYKNLNINNLKSQFIYNFSLIVREKDNVRR